MNGHANHNEATFDVVIVGAGISGINAAYRVQSEVPGATYTILECRERIGGTWDFWKYPGIRSDSDLHTFGFPWRPWTGKSPIADAASIISYVRETASMFGIDKHIRFRHLARSYDWDRVSQKWTITAESDGVDRKIYGKFLILGTGYYDYKNPLPTVIPGIENFKGQVIHPQFWPSDLDYAGKRVVVIGSGATAVTLVPAMSTTASHVTMLQRSPSYLMSLPNKRDNFVVRKFLPAWLSFRLERLWFLLVPQLFFRYCRAFPNSARRLLQRLMKRQLPPSVPVKPHFDPAYNPWEQRLCVCPDGDFFKAIRAGKASVETGTIKTFTDSSIVLSSGTELPADIVVTATGLKLLLAGGAKVSIDGQPVNPPDKFIWKGVMLQDVPNCAFVIGYTNASWTLGADATSLMVTRLIKAMRKEGATSVVPRVSATEAKSMRPVPILDLSSTYLTSAKDTFPMAGDRGPWKPRDYYLTDLWNARYGSIKDGLEYVKGGKEL